MRGSLSARHERWLDAALLLAYATGLAWMILHYGFNRDGELEDSWRIAETWMLHTHGAAAMAALVAFGSLLPLHIPSAWKLRRNLASGLSMLGAMALLVATGWLLYYASGESLRAASSYIHMGIGTLAPLALLWHLAYRARTVRAKLAKRARFLMAVRREHKCEQPPTCNY